MIKMYLKIQDIFTRPNEVLPDMSRGQTEFHGDWLCIHCLSEPLPMTIWLRYHSNYGITDVLSYFVD